MRATKKTPRQPPRDRRTRSSFEKKPVRVDFPSGGTAEEFVEAIRKLHARYGGKKKKAKTTRPAGEPDRGRR